MFKNQILNLLGKTHEEMLKYKDDPAAFEQVKTDLLGQIIRVVGRARNNELFNRLEFIAQLVFPNPDPEPEIEKVKAQLEKEQELPSIDEI